MTDSLKLRILLVDDDDIVRQMIDGMLTALNYEVVAARNGEEALRIFSAKDGFRMIITDINMPYMDGFQLATNLKRINPRIPIIAVTGENPDSVLPRIGANGIRRVLFKPLDIRILQDTVDEILRDHFPSA